MAETGGGAVERGAEEGVGAVEVHDGVAAGDVEEERRVELDTLGGDIGCDAGGG